MARALLVDALGDWLSRAEIVARGKEARFRAARDALAAGDVADALRAARALMDELPRSALALALWVDAARAAGVAEEALEAAQALCRSVPYRSDVWLVRAELEQECGLDARVSLETAAQAADPVAAADRARLSLCDLDLTVGDGERAEHWLDQLSVAGMLGPEVSLRRVRARLSVGDRTGARVLAKDLPLPATSDGPGWLLRAELLDLDDPRGDEALRRAVMLETPRAAQVAQQRLPCLEPEARRRWHALALDLGVAEEPDWALAFALSASADQFPRVIARALESARDAHTLQGLAAAALTAGDASALLEVAAAAEHHGAELSAEVTTLVSALRASGAARVATLSGLDTPFARQLRERWLREWLAPGSAANWDDLLPLTASIAEQLADVDAIRALSAIGRELEGPLVAAVVGEFNAGKSSFVNALLGEAVAATGVIPTTATLHRLTWSPDRIARVERSNGEPARVVPFARLKETLQAVDLDSVAEVRLLAPLELLKRVELLDTPGFNAPDSAHARAARKALQEAHVALWLLDATQALKHSERARLQEIARLGVPLLVLLNKADRLSAEELQSALAHVEEGLAAAELRPEGEVLAFSALLANPEAADPAAYERSGFEHVRSALDEMLGAKGRELKDRVLRERFREVVARLEQRGLARQSSYQASLSAEQAELAARGRWVERARQAPSAWIAGLEAILRRRLPELQAIARPVRGARVDGRIERFVGSRARMLWLDEICAELLRLGEMPSLSADGTARLQAGVGGVLRALGAQLTESTADAAVTRVATACVDVVTELGLAAPPSRSARPAWLLELEALSAAVLGGHPTQLPGSMPRAKEDAVV